MTFWCVIKINFETFNFLTFPIHLSWRMAAYSERNDRHYAVKSPMDMHSVLSTCILTSISKGYLIQSYTIWNST